MDPPPPHPLRPIPPAAIIWLLRHLLDDQVLDSLLAARRAILAAHSDDRQELDEILQLLVETVRERRRVGSASEQ